MSVTDRQVRHASEAFGEIENIDLHNKVRVSFKSTCHVPYCSVKTPALIQENLKSVQHQTLFALIKADYPTNLTIFISLILQQS